MSAPAQPGDLALLSPLPALPGPLAGEVAAAARRALVDSTPGTPLRPEHTRGCEVLPGRQSLLERLPSGGVVAEVGVAGGDFSAEILRIARPASSISSTCGAALVTRLVLRG